MKMKRVLSLLLSLVLLLGVLSPATAYAEDGYTPTNSFVLLHPDKTRSAAWEYFSPFTPKVIYDQKGIYGYSILFGLRNKDNTSVPYITTAYCTDLPVDTHETFYQRINLADSTYAAQQANKLRAIIRGGYPETKLEVLQERTGLADLTLNEAITGTQLAIWQTAHGSDMTISDFVYTYGEPEKLFYSSYYANANHYEEAAEEIDKYDIGDATYRAAVEKRIETLYNYLLGLEPQSAKRVVASEASFVSRNKQVNVSDETCSIIVHTTVNVQLLPGDSLTLTAYIDGGRYYAQETLSNGQKDYTLTITDVPVSLKDETVTLAIDGNQDSAGEVYLLDAEGIRGASQSMISVVNGVLPVHAQVNVEPDRVLQLHKTESGGGQPLANVTFEIYYVDDISDYLNGRLPIGSKPTDEDVAQYAISENLVATITTDASGNASFNFGTNSDGVYLVKEIANEVIVTPVAPFFVSIPSYDNMGNVTYIIEAFPKNSVTAEDVEIDKDVTSVGQDSDTFDVGQKHTWIISTTLPKSLASGQSYVITDTLDYRLTLLGIDKVTLENEEGTDLLLTLVENTDYVVEKAKVDDDKEHQVDHFTVSLTAAGMKKVAEKAGDSYKDCRLRVYFNAEINTNAIMGVEIPNHADVDYTNKVGKHFQGTSDQPKVYTGAVTLLKVDAQDDTKLLSGAVFELYRLDEDGEVELTIDSKKQKATKVSFYDNPELTGNKVDFLTTDENGKGYLYGLTYDTYYLVETKAPDGYHVRTEPIQITITGYSQNGEALINTRTITNSTDVLLPDTGGMGTWLFTVGGLCIMATAVALLIWNRKKQRA